MFKGTQPSCRREIARSRDRHILRYGNANDNGPPFEDLPVRSAAESWSFGTISKVIERGGRGALASSVAASIGVSKAGFPYRIRSLVYLRNRCAHHSRLWHHSVIDAGPTPNNVRSKAKRLYGQFQPRSILDSISSLDDMPARAHLASARFPALFEQYQNNTDFWIGLSHPQSPQDHYVGSRFWFRPPPGILTNFQFLFYVLSSKKPPHL
nr:Abi family protein [Glutamicibacter sp. JC586]